MVHLLVSVTDVLKSQIPCFGDLRHDFQGKVSVRNRSFRYLG